LESKSLPHPKSRSKSKIKKGSKSSWESLERFLSDHQTALAIIFCLLFALFGFALFDVRISIGGDDAAYIERGFKLVHYGEISFYQGPLYPAILGIGIALFGVNLIALKSMSFVFMLGQQVLLYFTFRKRIPFLVLFFVLFIIATNYFIQYYSSQTYTEGAFMFLQSLSLYFIFKLFDAETSESQWTENSKLWLINGFLLLLLSLCKSVAIVLFIPLIVFFLVQKKWRSASKAFLAFLIWKIIYELAMRIFYQAPDIGQFKQILLKDLYNPTLGIETIPGLFERFFENSNTYLSMNLLRFLSIQDKLDTTANAFITILVAVALIASTVYLFRKNKYLFFLALYSLILYAGIFFGIQASNRQSRLIIIVLPLTYFLLFGSAYYLSRNNFRLGIAIISAIVLVSFIQIKNTLYYSNAHLPLLKKNLKGDMYFGYSPDWINYLKLSSWCGENLPNTSLVACRKASMSFIYSKGMHFYEINQAIGFIDPDSMLIALKHAGVTHILIAKIRANPQVNNGEIINTIHRVFVPIFKKYPERLKFLLTFGKDEEASLYEIIY